MALLSHDDGLIYKSYMLEFHEYKKDLKNVGNNEQMKHKRKENIMKTCPCNIQRFLKL